MALDKRICPWCDTEIVWDPEIGPEEHCPNCLNELGDYRSIRLRIDPTDEEGADVGPDDEDGEAERPNFAAAGTLNPRAGTDLAGVEGVLAKILDSQDELPDCERCGEYMLLAGTQTVTGGFEPVAAAVLGAGAGLLTAPFRLNLYLCPSCFKAEYQLSDEDRQKLAERLRAAADAERS